MRGFGRVALVVSALLVCLTFHLPLSAAWESKVSGSPQIWLVESQQCESEGENKMSHPSINPDPEMAESPVGDWGGEHISLQVTERGGRVEYDCAHGTIDKQITLDRRGRFDVLGTHVEEHGGPTRAGEQPHSYPVRLRGQISVDKMRLRVTRLDAREVIGTFNLVRGQEPLLVKCR